MFDRLLDAVLSVIDKFYFLAVVDQYEGGVLLRFGKYVKTLEPGIHWRIPFGVDRIITASVVYDTMVFEDKVLTLTDGVSISYGVVVGFLVDDPKAFLLEVEGAESALADSVLMEVPRVLSDREFSDLLNPTVMEEVNKELTKSMRVHARRFGIRLQKLAITNLAKTRVLMLLGQ